MALDVTISPLSTTIVFGEAVSFIATVTGYANASNLTYQWKKGGVNLTGAGNQSATYVHTPSGVGSDSITCYVAEGGNNDTSPASVITIASVYTTIASANGYLAKIAKAI